MFLSSCVKTCAVIDVIEAIARCDLMYTGIRTGYYETNDTCAYVRSDLGNCPSSNNHQGDRDWTAQNLKHDVP